jgi:hypothetical protein
LGYFSGTEEIQIRLPGDVLHGFLCANAVAMSIEVPSQRHVPPMVKLTFMDVRRIQARRISSQPE